MTSSFLSVGAAAIPMAGSDLGQLLRARIATPIGTRAVVLDPRPIRLSRWMTADISRPVLRPMFNGMSQAVVHAQEQGRTTPAFNVQHIAEGTFTEKTIDNMHKAVLSAKTDSRWRETMENIRRAGREAGAIGWKDWLGEVNWFNRFYRGDHFIDYVRDPHQVELVMHPWHTFIKKLGDCDDSSTLWAGSMGALGAAHKFRTYKADPRRPNDWSHVVSQVFVPGHGWVNNDLTIRQAFPGFEPEGFPFKDWHEPKW